MVRVPVYLFAIALGPPGRTTPGWTFNEGIRGARLAGHVVAPEGSEVYPGVRRAGLLRVPCGPGRFTTYQASDAVAEAKGRKNGLAWEPEPIRAATPTPRSPAP